MIIFYLRVRSEFQWLTEGSVTSLIIQMQAPNHPSSFPLHSEHQVQERLERINHQLALKAYPSLSGLSSCQPDDLTIVLNAVEHLVQVKEQEEEKNNQKKHENYRIVGDMHRMQKRLDETMDENERLVRVNQELQENIKTVQKDSALREGLSRREVGELQKQLKQMAQRENQMANENKKALEENKRVNDKVRKMMEKSDKCDFKNFALSVPQTGQGQRNSKEEYEQAMVSKFDQRMSRIQKELVTLQEWMTEVLQRLQEVALKVDPSIERIDERIGRVSNVLTDGPILAAREFIALIDSKLSEQRRFFSSPLNPESRDSQALVSSLQEMKNHFGKWQELYSRKTQVMRDVLSAVRHNKKISEDVEREVTSDGSRDQGEQCIEEGVSRQTRVNEYVRSKLCFFREQMSSLSRAGRQVELLTLND